MCCSPGQVSAHIADVPRSSALSSRLNVVILVSCPGINYTVGQAIVFCGLPSSVGRTGAPAAFVGLSAFFWPVELILGHYASASEFLSFSLVRSPFAVVR